MRSVDTYRVKFVDERRVTSNRITRTVNVTSQIAFNRTARTLRVNQTVRSPAGTVSIRTYVTNRTLYERSPVYVRQFDSKWIKARLGVDFSAQWSLLDTLSRQRALLNNATVDLLGATTVDGADAYVIRADVNETTYTRTIEARFESAAGVNVTEAAFTFWIDAETGRPLRSVGTVNSTALISGQVVTIHEELQLQFTDYDHPVNVTLPGGADTAVAVGNATAADG